MKLKHKDPYKEALEIYNNTISNLNFNIAQAMNNLFICGDIRYPYLKVMMIYGFEYEQQHGHALKEMPSIIFKRSKLKVMDIKNEDLG